MICFTLTFVEDLRNEQLRQDWMDENVHYRISDIHSL